MNLRSSTLFPLWTTCLLSAVVLIGACSSFTPRQRSTFVDGPTGRLHVVHSGSSAVLPVLFVHSFAGSAAHWEAQMAHLRPTRRVVALDLRGHGQSDSPQTQSAYMVEAMARDIGAAADALGLQRFVLVGHSLGGAVASAYAVAQPQRVAGLVLVGAPGRTPAEQSMPVMTSLRADYAKTSEGYWRSLLEGVGPENERTLLRDMQRMSRETGLALIGAVFSYDPNPALAAYPGPQLIIDTPHGDGPSALHNQLPGIPRKVVTGTSHWVQMDKPDEFNAILDEFLATAS